VFILVALESVLKMKSAEHLLKFPIFRGRSGHGLSFPRPHSGHEISVF
jgi:hypothetical protein